ncbi:MAG: 50S ribosomal protein L35 [Candidatus Margulisbacteria bacterium]|nr:50S ribosomal protein L35 [Candidatus Margulisiibacteriota bacterium]
MPKMKTRSSAKKRFKLTGSGKIRHYKINNSHILEKESQKRKKNRQGLVLLDSTNTKKIKRMLAI